MTAWESVLSAFELLIVVHTVGYFAFQALLLAAGFSSVRRQVRSLGFEDLDMMDGEADSLPGIAVLVPAYNEAAVLVDAVRALTELDYPHLEIVVVNDGSSDDTRDVLRHAFRMRRRDIPLRSELPTAPVRGIYEATVDLPDAVDRLVLVDKENGGKADSLNCALNVSISPYFISIDADSILDPKALKQILRVFQQEPDTVAAGGQVGVVNDCTLEDGHIVRRAVPRRPLALCQTVEYVRSFSIARTGFSNLDALIILSGAFMVMTRKAALEVGGFLTGRSDSRLLAEYVGDGRTTICEDMEIIVRLHRFAREQGQPGRIVHTPLPVCWTELPEDADSLGKQRRRWHRGLLEILRYHRTMFLNPEYGRVGMLAMPYYVWFETLGPMLELLGWILLPLLAVTGLLEPGRAVLVLGLATGAGVLQSVLAVVAATWLEPVSPGGHRMRSMLGTDSWRDRLRLLAGCFLSEMGYRQMTLFWRARGTWDYLVGRQGWDKFERRGFKAATTAAVTAAFLTLGASPTAAAATRLEAHVGQDAQSDGIHGWWGEAFAARSTGRWSAHAGVVRVERERIGHEGLLAGAGVRGRRAGIGVEGRWIPGSTVSYRQQWSLDAEVAMGGGVSAAWRGTWSDFPGSRVTSAAPGIVVYRGDGWLALRAMAWWSRFEAGGTDRVTGFDARLSVPWRGRELRASLGSGAESYSVGRDLDPGRIRAWHVGTQWREPFAGSWTAIVGVVHRRPDRGQNNVYVETGLIRRF